MQYDRLDDETLLRLAARSEPDALGALYDRYSRLVYGLALHVTGDPPLAEEITQDVFLRVWQHAAEYRPGQGKLSGWLAGITRHRAIDVYRHHQTDAQAHSHPWDDLPQFDPPDSQNIEQEADQRLDSRRVRQALAALPTEQRQALALAYFRGYTQEEIAQALEQPLGTVKTRIRLGMQKLRSLLAGE